MSDKNTYLLDTVVLTQHRGEVTDAEELSEVNAMGLQGKANKENIVLVCNLQLLNAAVCLRIFIYKGRQMKLCSVSRVD